MNTLANSLWSVSCNEAETGSDVIRFFPDGRALIAYPDGTISKGHWAEAPDGHFVFQSPISPANPNRNQVYFGVYGGEQANGFFCEVNREFMDFTMQLES